MMEKPYRCSRVPTLPVNGATDAIVVVLCLSLHAYITAKGMWFQWVVPGGYEEWQLLLYIVSTGVGFGCSVSCVRKASQLTRLVGTLGLVWFGLLVTWVLFVGLIS
jgi:hypothetical protein